MVKREKVLYGGLRALSRELASERWRGARFVVVLDENTFEHCLPLLVSNVEALQEASFVEVPLGEECKSLEVAAQVWQTLLDGQADRQTVLVNLGGGSVCDLGGFVASGYMRGIRHIHVPTTLLAMVDAAIGGKTAVDFGGVKNSVGHFYPAVATVIEPAFLATLPPEQMRCGLVEMVKTAAVADAALYASLIVAGNLLPRQLKQVARIKAQVVKSDPYDFGNRRILNFGHTFGHAVEVYSSLPHGSAVGVGMKAAMRLSMRREGLADDVYKAYSQWLEHIVECPRYSLADARKVLALMHYDKKSLSGSLQCVLLRAPGKAVVDVSVSDDEVLDALRHL